MLWMWFLPRQLDCIGGEYCNLKGKNRYCTEQCERKGGTGNRDKICWNVFASHHHQKKGWQRREMLEKMQRNTCERLPCPGLSSLQVEKIPHEAVWRRGELDTVSFSSHRFTILQGCLHFVWAILVISQICHHLPNKRTLHGSVCNLELKWVQAMATSWTVGTI